MYTDNLIFGELTGDGDMKVATVLLNGTEIGSLRVVAGMMQWNPGAGSTELGLQIVSMVAGNREALEETLTDVIERQLRRLAEGKALRESDIDVLDPELRAYTSERGIGRCIQHPLIYAVPYMEMMAPHYNMALKLKKVEVAKALAEGNWHQYIFWHERPYRLQAFFDVLAHGHLSDQEYWELLGSFWTDSDNIHQNFRDWRQMWSAKLPAREHAMSDDEREALAKLPDMVMIYRGFRHKASMRGMSWSVNRDRAVWFANRYRDRGEKAYLATAQVRKARILAHFLGRNEDEIVVLPKDLKQVEFVELPPNS